MKNDRVNSTILKISREFCVDCTKGLYFGRINFNNKVKIRKADFRYLGYVRIHAENIMSLQKKKRFFDFCASNWRKKSNKLFYF